MKGCQGTRRILQRRSLQNFRSGFQLAVLILLFVPSGVSQTAADSESAVSSETNSAIGLTLQEFRSLIRDRLTREASPGRKSRDPLPTPDLTPADNLFLQLLLIQAKDNAVHRSVERLSEWGKAIQARYQIQTAPELDLEVARFVEARMAVESARLEAEQARLIGRANQMLGRPADSPLLAVLPEGAAAEKQAGEVLAQGEKMIAKMYESYQFGGISITSLMEYENAVYEFELEYRETMARNAVSDGLE